MGRALKIIFAGTPEFAVPSLQALMDACQNVIAVYTQPDRPQGRGRQLKPSPVKQLASASAIPVFQPENFRDKADVDMLRALQADLMVVVAYGLILPTKVLEAPRYGCINVHASLLPRWRGAAPIQRAILAGDDETGVSIMQMEAGLDTGSVGKVIRCPIRDTDTSATLHDTLARLGAEALLMMIDDIVGGRCEWQKQREQMVTYANKITKEEACIDWHKPARDIVRAIRAYFPAPVAYTFIDDKRIRIFEAEISDEKTDVSPGTILAVSEKGLTVAALEKTILITKLQFPGKKPQAVSALINSYESFFAIGKVCRGHDAQG